MNKLLCSLLVSGLCGLFLPLSVTGNVIINEVMSSNGLTIADEDGDFEDWVELWNSGDTAVDLSGYGLSDDPDRPMRWVFPEGVVLGPDAYLLVWPSGKDRRDPDGELHTNFGISSAGEPVLLTAPDGTLVDELPEKQIPRNISYGRGYPDVHNEYFYAEPTPGGPNETTGYINLLRSPTFTVEPGFYPGEITVGITYEGPEDGVELYYSLDGSRQIADATPYSDPITFSSRAGEPNGISMIPTNPPQVPEHIRWEAPIGEVMKANILTAIPHKEGYLALEPRSGTYFVGPEWLDRFSLNLISIVADPEDLFGHEAGIYVPGKIHEDNEFTGESGRPHANYFQRGAEWERPISFEYFDPATQQRLTDGHLSMRIHGGSTRVYPQKSLRLYDRGSVYGGDGLNYPFFWERPYQDFSRLILRNSGQDWHHFSNVMFLDAFLQRLLKDMNFEYQAYEPSVLFLNGEYWGIHNIRERIDKYFIEQQYGVDPDQLDMLTGNAEVDEGSNEHYLAMLDFMRNSDMNDPQNLAQVNEMMDVDNYMDYIIAQTFIANWDWPGNNVDFWRLQTDYHPDKPKGHDGRWRWILYDLDFAFIIYEDEHGDHPRRNMFEHLTNPTDSMWPNPPWSVELINLLWESEDFTKAFITRYTDHLNTTLRPNRSWQLLDTMPTPLRNEIIPHHQRWGRGDFTLDQWERYIGHHMHFADVRYGIVWQHLQDHFNVGSPVEITLRNNDTDKGVLQIHDMRLEEGHAGWVWGRPAEWQGHYFPELPVQVTAVPDPGYAFAGWLEFPNHDSATIEFYPGETSALTATFEPGPEHQLLHYWHFNNTNTLESLLEPSYTMGDPSIAVQPGPATEVEDGGGNGFDGENARLDTPTGRHLRINNPLGAQVDIALPSEGFHSLRFAYETRRSGQGAGIQQLYYTVDGTDYEPLQTLVVIQDDPILHIWDFDDIEGASNNPDFAIRIEFEQGDGGTAGNNRFDNMTLEGVPYTDFLSRDVIASAGGWNQSAAFGRIATANNRWAYHKKAGWIYAAHSKNAMRGAWIWSESLERWLWISSRIGPNRAYDANSEAWLYWDASEQQWVAIPEE